MMNKKIIHTVFEERVKKSPKNIAIVYGDEQISYKALNSRANGVGNLLESEQYIALFLPNNIDYVITLLGVLKAGSVFVPMDILAPNERIYKIIQKAQIETIITNRENVKNLVHILATLKLETKIMILEEIEAKEENLELKSTEDSSAYLMFTSGSTGEPKAIIGMQKSLSHFIHWECGEFEIDESFKISQLAGVTFDVSLRDIFTALISGATLCIPKERTDIGYLAQWIEESHLTLIHIVPSLFRLLVKEFEFNDASLSTLKHILLAGEALYGSDVLNFTQRYPHIELVNLYGPSETTLAKIFNRIKREEITNPNMIIPLGKPISNTAILILKNNTLAQVKQVGEIYIKTPFRSKGYLKEEALTKEVFVQNPLSDKEDILYKTGDMGRYSADGTVEFVGRADNQVKINGIRVELLEIESAIKSYPKVENAIIVSEVSASKEIVVMCYYTEKSSFEQSAMREYLIEVIPSYMIPNFFIKMESFPLNFHGKVDKKSLPKPADLLYRDREFIAPQGEIQKALAQIFAQILRVDKVSADITFTQLGGNSLNSISATAKISHTFGVQINIKAFFENQSVEKLSKLIENAKKIETKKVAITPAPKSNDYALSNSQRRLWVLDKLQENFNSYNIAGAIAFEGEVDAPRLQEAIEGLILRHEILRTNFITLHNSPRQIIKETIPQGVFESVEVEDSQSYMQEEAKRVFDLERDALFYLKLINGHILFINMHHIISDGWSIGLIIEELSQRYTDKKSTFEPLVIQYKDYAHWQNSLLEDDAMMQEHKAYWHTLLENPTTLNFPLDNPRGKQQTFEGETHYFTIDNRLTSKLLEISKESTLFITLLTVSNILLAKYSNQEDIIVGTPVANREEGILSNQIGFYVNTLALRSRLNRDKSFQENLLAIKDMALASFAYQDYPFDKLVDELKLERDLTQNPLFNIMVILQNNESGEIKFDNLKSSAKKIDTKTSKLDMTLNYTQINHEIELMIEYNTNLFNASTIQRLFENLETLIDSITLDKTLKELAFISNNEQNLLKSFNNIQKAYPKDKTISQLFESQVEKTPHHIAVIAQETTLTYQELNSRANQLGAYLRENYTLTPETIIPIILEKSERMILSLLGVLKAGCAYLPIDSEYPQERMTYMLKDSQAKVLLTDSVNVDKINNYCKDLAIEVVCVDDVQHSHSDNLECINNASDLAYIIYTSGTTGQPKGVMVEHRSFVNMILYQIESFNILPEDKVIQFASFSFDASVYETFLALLAGASYLVINKDALLDNFVEITKKHSVNTAVLNPTFLANIGELDNFKTIITAGEKAIPKDALKYAQKCHYINAYGPTEVSICSAFHKVDANKAYNSIPIGKSIANSANYILNDNLEEMPIGAVGEICTAGEGVVRGYLHREDLTHEKFIQHPKYGRIYKTGDIGKYDENGDIEYLGRVDNQVKMRGFRIELSEIENTILAYPSIKECVVIVSNQQLIAYIVGEEKELKVYLQQKLPHYMIPSYVIALEKLPLTPNGKIDTKALPTPTIESKERVKPQTELESVLCGIFESVLGVEVGVSDSFFDFGGDSIKAIQISSRLSEAGYKIEIKELFAYPRIAELIPFVRKNQREIDQQEVIGKIKLTPIQKWFFALPIEDKSYFNQDLLLEIEGEIDAQRIESIAKELLVHHDILRATYKKGKQYNNAISDTKVSVKTYHITQESEIEEKTQKLSSSFKLSKSPLIKFALIDSATTKYLYIVAHHLVIDGVSWRILMEDMITLYNGGKLPLKTDSFKAYAKRLNGYKKEIKEEREFWKERSFDFDLKVDKKIDTRLLGNQKAMRFSLDKEQTKDILENINFAYNTTTQDILLIALNTAIYKTFGLKKSLIGLESHGREEDVLGLNLSRTVGWFTALYPLRLEFEEADLGTQIKVQKEHIRQTPHNGIGYGVLKYLAKENLDFSKEILFNYLGQFEDAPKSLFNMSQTKTASSLSEDFISEFKLDIAVVIVNKMLDFSIRYDKDEYKEGTIQTLLDNYRDALKEIVGHCLTKKSVELTPDDIDDDDFDIDALDEFLNDLDLEA